MTRDAFAAAQVHMLATFRDWIARGLITRAEAARIADDTADAMRRIAQKDSA